MTNHERIKQAFDDIKAPEGFADKILKAPENTSASITKVPIIKGQGQSRRFRIGFVAAAAVIALMFATTALAANGVIDFSSIFQSIFGNEAATQFIQTGEDITAHASEGEVEVEIIAAFQDNGIFLDMLLTDEVGGRLSERLMLISWNETWGKYHLIGDSVYAQLIDENTMRASVFLPAWVDSPYQVRFDMIASGVQFFPEIQTELNVGAHIGIENPIIVPGEVVEITAVSLDGDMLTVASRVSGLAVRGTSEYTLGIMKPDGEIIWFGDGGGTIDIGGSCPHELVFVWSGLRAEHIFTGNWDFTITPDDTALKPGTFIGEFEGHHAEVVVSATNARVRIYGIDRDTMDEIWEEDSLALYLADGTTVLPSIGASEVSSYLALIVYDMEFINPEEVVRVTFRGIPIGG